MTMGRICIFRSPMSRLQVKLIGGGGGILPTHHHHKVKVHPPIITNNIATPAIISIQTSAMISRGVHISCQGRIKLQLVHNSTTTLLPPTQQQRKLSSRAASSRKGGKRSRKKVDDNTPLLNEHLVAELFNKMKGNNENITADTYEVRLFTDEGYDKKKKEKLNGESDEKDNNFNSSSSSPTSQLTTLNEAIDIAHNKNLDLMEVTLHVSPPVIKAVDFDKWSYEQKKKQSQATSKKKKEGGGAISDRPLKEFKFRAGIADHDLERKTANMVKYLEKGHAIRVTLTARMRSLNADAEAIQTTLARVKELVGDRAVEARGMKANDRKSYGSLLLHPSKGSKG